ncbi:tetratricopeptide repeat protein [Vibrio sp.]|jgi:TPR repeat protein|uniref:tetratricopeptide repeat protein n=1 Tax=Vibrio sp. TaxID=678 RepID=UPI003F6A634D
MGIAIGATALSLILVAVWLISLSLRKQRLEQERKARAVAYRKAIEKARIQEQKERNFKAETGHVPSILYLAKEAERNNIKEALYWYDKAAHLDNVTGMYGIVRMSMKRKEDLILREKANFWQLAISALENDMVAKFEMGKALVFGRGTDKNIPKGYTYIEESATGGNTEAMLFMGEWCLDKENPDYSAESSFEWYQKAADKNNLDGKIKLGLSYLNGVGVEPNHGEAVYWFETAAEKNSAEAMFRAGEAWIDHGEHGNAIAYIWLFLSAHFGYSEAKQLRDKVGGELGVDAVVGLQALTKPIMIKLTQEAATKHSVVKALNKLYKRNIPIPKKVKDVTEEEELDVSKAKGSDAEMNDQINAQDANPERNQQYTSEQHAAIQTGVPQNTDKASSPSPSGASLDFSQTNWSNKN